MTVIFYHVLLILVFLGFSIAIGPDVIHLDSLTLGEGRNLMYISFGNPLHHIDLVSDIQKAYGVSFRHTMCVDIQDDVFSAYESLVQGFTDNIDIRVLLVVNNVQMISKQSDDVVPLWKLDFMHACSDALPERQNMIVLLNWDNWAAPIQSGNGGGGGGKGEEEEEELVNNDNDDEEIVWEPFKWRELLNSKWVSHTRIVIVMAICMVRTALRLTPPLLLLACVGPLYKPRLSLRLLLAVILKKYEPSRRW